MSKFVGITIGPIVETISETSKPAGLWFASSIFSDITRRLCYEISNGVMKGEILSPYYDGEENMSDGVGKYHDRIIFKTDHYDRDEINQIICKVKEETISNFPMEQDSDKESETEFLRSYIQIQFVAIHQEELKCRNAVLSISPYLDSLELLKSVPTKQEKNPFERILKGTRSNAMIEKSKLFTGIEDGLNQFQVENHENKIRDIEEIARGRDKTKLDYKRTKYFATISADGDGMGKFLNNLACDEDIRCFSKACLDYDKRAAEIIRNYGGMTIYAGGDDLLFIAPIVNQVNDKEQSVFSLCSEINQEFRSIVSRSFEKREDVLKDIPTISFGIAIRYYKYPLYEALSNSRGLLSYVKNTTDKNAMAIQIEKHSGQSMGIVVPHESIEPFEKTFHINCITDEETQSEADRVKSVIYTIENMKSLIQVLDKQNLNKDDYWNSWKNFFDNADQKKAEKFHEEICNYYYEYISKQQSKIRTLKESEESKDKEACKDTINTLTSLLRIDKFLKEGRGDQE